MICDIFIRSYWKDLDWLVFALASIEKYCHGFREVIVVLPRSSEAWLRRTKLPGRFRVELCRDYGDDYLGQQATKLLADAFTDAAYICHIDADCIFFRPTAPDDLMDEGKPRVLKMPYRLLGRHRPWQRPTEKFLGWKVQYDFMRHPPFLFPRWIYREVRDHAIAAHGVDIETYIASQPPRGFSEFNVLSALGWRRHRAEFTWVDATACAQWEPRCRWYWSWGGIDDSIRAEIQHDLRWSAD